MIRVKLQLFRKVVRNFSVIHCQWITFGLHRHGRSSQPFSFSFPNKEDSPRLYYVYITWGLYRSLFVIILLYSPHQCFSWDFDLFSFRTHG